MMFYLGTHLPTWLKRVNIPLFVSRRVMPKRLAGWRVTCPWALDSGGFTELTLYGRWTITEEQYINEVRSYLNIGGLQWASAMDWMCEEQVIHGGVIAGRRAPGTGLSVRVHQEKTVENYVSLLNKAPDLPWVPVIQGYHPSDYMSCVRLYEIAGVDLRKNSVVGLGSICRRQSTGGITEVSRDLWQHGIKLHGFGVKLMGIKLLSPYLASSDSMAWSYAARRLQKPLDECLLSFREGARPHKNCANCLRYAMAWRKRVVRELQ